MFETVTWLLCVASVFVASVFVTGLLWGVLLVGSAFSYEAICRHFGDRSFISGLAFVLGAMVLISSLIALSVASAATLRVCLAG